MDPLSWQGGAEEGQSRQPQLPPDASGIRIGDVGGSVNFSALGDIVGGDKITTITTTIQISVEAVTQRPLITASPYRGLDRFEDRDKDLFFGRDQLIKSLLAQLSASNVLLVLGASGSGKSSVVRAGLLPQLAQLIGARFRYFTFVPDVNPFESLRSALHGAGFSQAQTRELADAKPETPTNLIHTLQRTGDQWLFFVDQFEEIFTVGDEKLRASFIAALVAIAQDPNSSTKLVLAMRADFLDRFSPFPQFAKIIEKNIDFVADMHPDELRLAIEQPAARHGVVFEQGLVEEIIKDVQGQAGSLPLLQYTLDLLWQEEAREDALADRHLNARAYRELGGVRGALQKRADEIYSSFGDGSDAKAATPKQEVVRQIFLRLVDLAGEGPNDAAWRPVRRRASMAMFTEVQEQEILQALINQKLLVSNREGDDATVEVAHEALFTSWGRLKNWIDAGKQVIFARNRLADDARRWQRRQQEDASGSEEELLSGTRLAQALDMRARGDFVTVVGGLNPVEVEFLEASAKEAERRRNFQTVAARRVRMALYVALVLLVAAAGSGIFAFQKAHTAQQTLADADFLQGAEMIERDRVDEALAHLARAVRTSAGHDAARDRIFTLLTGRRFFLPTAGPVSLPGRATSVRFLPDGRCLVAVIRGSTAQVLDARTAATVMPAVEHDGKPVQMAQISPDGSLLATACGSSNLSSECAIWPRHRDYANEESGGGPGYGRVWDIATGKPLSPRLPHTKAAQDIRFDAAGARIATASADGTARVWDARSGKALTDPLPHGGPVESVRFSPDGSRLLTVAGTAQIWTLQPLQKLSIPGLESAIVAEFSSDGKTIAVVTTDSDDDGPFQVVHAVNAATGEKPAKQSESMPVVTSLTFDPDGSHILFSGAARNLNKDDTGGILDVDCATGESRQVETTGGMPVFDASLWGQNIIAAFADRSVKVFTRYGTDENLPLPIKLPATSKHVELDPPTGRMAILSGDDTVEWVQLWNPPTQIERSERITVPKLPEITEPEPDNVAGTIADRRGASLLRFETENSINVENAETGVKKGRPMNFVGGYVVNFRGARFSPSGRLVVLREGGDFRIAKGFARIWNASTGLSVTPPLVHHRAVTFAQFTTDERRLITIESKIGEGSPSAARIWDVRTGIALSEVMTSRAHGHIASPTADGLRLIISSSEEKADVWDTAFPAHGRAPSWLPQLAEAVGGLRLGETGVLESVPNRAAMLDTLRTALSSDSADPFALFGRWFFADPARRTISPFSKVTVPEDNLRPADED